MPNPVPLVGCVTQTLFYYPFFPLFYVFYFLPLELSWSKGLSGSITSNKSIQHAVLHAAEA